jgi:hypothetical protein
MIVNAGQSGFRDGIRAGSGFGLAESVLGLSFGVLRYLRPSVP